ncbi:pentatricopeptide repeat-containing protein At5g47360 [Phoenix dactylifera]|uniref:Pentatricopeptide repeat-containing protein At5g47360 n=1 Tax=Phoenix dactylifera TaxID=42345 RepID=A0A8B7BIS3_PHODC|nr:pentatricopeptide repeat-containing protein At5g47360 [Phoenix dactylifera]XP_038984584.1 pentatricopeptide repeat-containing protein At5g47360 [Phoenix dactylifera]
MAFSTIPRSLFSFLPNSFETPFPYLSVPRLLSTAAAAAELCHLLRSNSSLPAIERVLSRSQTKLDPSIVQSVLRQSSDRVLALRFFVWAGLQPRHRHSAAAYAAASDSLQIPRRPQALTHLLDSYRAADAPVSLKTFKILLNLCRHANLPDEALALLRRMPEFDCRPDTSSYNTVLRLLADSGRGEIGAALLEEMAMARASPDMVTYVTAVRGLCAVAKIEAAQGLVARMRANGCVPNVVVYTALLDGACSCGDLVAAMRLLDEMESELDDGCAPNAVTYTCLIKCLCEKGQGRLEEALEILDRMGRRGCPPNRVTVGTIVNGFCAQGKFGGAYELIERVVGEGSVSSEDCYSLLVGCLLRVGNVQEAEDLMTRMLEKGISPSGVACNSLLRELCNRRQFMDGYNWFQKMEEKGLACVDSDVCALLLVGLHEKGHSTETSILGRKLVERGIHMEAFSVDGVVEVLQKFSEGDLTTQSMITTEPR